MTRRGEQLALPFDLPVDAAGRRRRAPRRDGWTVAVVQISLFQAPDKRPQGRPSSRPPGVDRRTHRSWLKYRLRHPEVPDTPEAFAAWLRDLRAWRTNHALRAAQAEGLARAWGPQGPRRIEDDPYVRPELVKAKWQMEPGEYEAWQVRIASNVPAGIADRYMLTLRGLCRRPARAA